MLLKSLPPPASMVDMAQGYSLSFPGSPAAEYIKHRGLDSIAARMGLGYVAHPATGHEKQAGRLVIPYLRPAGGEHAVATIRFRCIAEECTKNPDGSWREDEEHEGHGKYQSLPGSRPMLYNTQALIQPSPYIGLSEGEFDGMAAELAGIPTPGVSGVSAWRDHFDPAFLGYERVFGFTDGDGPGEQFIAKLAERLPNLIPIYFDKKYDVCRFVKEFGPQALREKCGLS
ncbi:toprim domain-containing protein [Streptomyces vinaceus]|uniref:toprim domain-containing protein n=1 Tax=Streptomyces vinaceus TaxID=1960 RepID=UPI00369DB33B